jgi:predicted transcriptional regulator
MRDNGTGDDKLRDKALKSPAVLAEYEQFKLEYELAEQLKSMRLKMHFSQEVVAQKMHSSKSAVSRLEAAKGGLKHSPSISTLKRYADAIGCILEIKLKPSI